MNLIPKAAQFSDQSVSAFLDRVRVGTIAAFFVVDTFMQNLPDDSAQAVSNGPDRLEMTPPWGQPPINTLPLAFTAALAAWLRRRRMCLLPLGELSLVETSALPLDRGNTPPKRPFGRGRETWPLAGPLRP